MTILPSVSNKQDQSNQESAPGQLVRALESSHGQHGDLTKKRLCILIMTDAMTQVHIKILYVCLQTHIDLLPQ